MTRTPTTYVRSTHTENKYRYRLHNMCTLVVKAQKPLRTRPPGYTIPELWNTRTNGTELAGLRVWGWAT